MRLKLAGILAALSLTAVPAGAHEPKIHPYCGHAVGGYYTSPHTGHRWKDVFREQYDVPGHKLGLNVDVVHVHRYVHYVDVGEGWRISYRDLTLAGRRCTNH